MPEHIGKGIGLTVARDVLPFAAGPGLLGRTWSQQRVPTCQRLVPLLAQSVLDGLGGSFFLNRNAETLGMLGPSPKPEGLNPRA